MKIGIYCICTGIYITFLELFYRTSLQNLCPDIQKKYLVLSEVNPRKFNIFKDASDMIWKYTTNECKTKDEFFLYKCDLIKNNIHLLDDCDLILVPNINYIFDKRIDLDEIYDANKKLSLSQRAQAQFDFENNPNSSCFVPKSEAKYYVMGGWIFGRKQNVINCYNEIYSLLKDDLKNIGNLPLWSDESALNKYIFKNEDDFYITIDLLHPIYCKIKDYINPYRSKITILEKRWFFPNYNIEKDYCYEYLIRPIRYKNYHKTSYGIMYEYAKDIGYFTNGQYVKCSNCLNSCVYNKDINFYFCN